MGNTDQAKFQFITMRYAVTLLLCLFALSILHGQNAKKKLKILQKENDSLRLELQKCQSGPFQRLTESLESPKFGENPIYSRAELQAKLLPQIKLKSGEKHAIAVNIIASTDQFLAYCEAIKAELIQRAGGLDPNTGQPMGMRDKKIPTEFFLDEKRGAELKQKIDDLSSEFLKAIQDNPYFVPRIVLHTESLPAETTRKSWEEFKFKAMPLAAIFPMIGKYTSDAKASEAAVLQYLNE